MYFALWLIRRCRLPATPAFSLPDAVNLKRFFTPDFVFSFGISRRSLGPRPSKRVDEPPWHAFWPGGSEGLGRYAKASGEARTTKDINNTRGVCPRTTRTGADSEPPEEVAGDACPAAGRSLRVFRA